MTAACVPLGLTPSFGFGDRTGLATPGHVAAMQFAGAGIAPIFPQQSIREMTRTSRTPAGVMQDALNGMRAAGWKGVSGADADHLKTYEDIQRTADVGFTFFTLDPSGKVDPLADTDSESTLRSKYAQVAPQLSWLEKYRGRAQRLSTGTTITFDEPTLMRAAVKYGLAIELALDLSREIERVQAAAGRAFEIELSVDETETPTSAAEHYLIADVCLQAGMRLVSLAPRFVGEFEKGVDFKGDLQAFEASLADHAAIAQELGPYKLSLHSGSDKLSVYPQLARLTNGCFHVKTAGTSYLEALRVAARHEPAFFAEVIRFARERYDVDKATYHVSATLADAPAPTAQHSPRELEELYLECWDQVPAGRGFIAPGRQILHCTFGSVLTNEKLGPQLRDILVAHADIYASVLQEHFVRHLEALQAGM